MKSETAARNLVSLSNPCHLWKTLNGRKARPLLLEYVERATLSGQALHAGETA